jgi:GT2 family glycosyltransferase/2-polyprenyl-3-methyl-5-hydroxy-6-metoxy-1,4-benzoquinol methylase
VSKTSGFEATDVSVVIPTRNRWDILARTISAIEAQTKPGCEIIVVVNGEDQTPPPLEGVRVVQKDDAGPGAGRNTGARASTRDLILFLGDDTIPEPDLLQRHLDFHNQHPEDEAAVLGFVKWHPSVASNRLNRWLDWSLTQFDYDMIKDQAGQDVGWGRLFASNLTIKREFLLSVGGFDTDFYFGYEDLDLGLRLAEKGMALYFEPQAVVEHLHGYEWQAIAGRFDGVAISERLMCHKHPGFEPFFLQRCQLAMNRRVTLPVERVCDLVPDRYPRLQAKMRDHANARYYRRIAPNFIRLFETAGAVCELVDYLGEEYTPVKLKTHAAIVDEEADAVGDDTTFYRTSQNYLYDLTVFSMTETKIPYVEALKRYLPRGGSVLDYGCGIGSDGLRLLEEGYRVSFADFDNPSVAYLRERLKSRGISAPIYNIETDIDASFDAVYCFDVIEHVDDPLAILDRLEHLGDLVVVNFLEPDPNDVHVHKPLPVKELLDHAAQRGLVFYRRYWNRSHLVVYRGRSSTFHADGNSTRILRRGVSRAWAEDHTRSLRTTWDRARQLVH